LAQNIRRELNMMFHAKRHEGGVQPEASCGGMALQKRKAAPPERRQLRGLSVPGEGLWTRLKLRENRLRLEGVIKKSSNHLQ